MEIESLQVFAGNIANATRVTRESRQRLVVKEHRYAVARDVNITLENVGTGRKSCGEPTERVFNEPRHVAAVGENQGSGSTRQRRFTHAPNVAGASAVTC